MTSEPPPTIVSDPIRLAALDRYGILDTAPEEGFDDVVALATHICDAPVALISLVADGRQWFKARIGFEPCETPIGQSVCAHALSEPELLVIPDLRLDPRTRLNGLVTGEPFVRFYAGAVLRSPGGHALGTICVLDTGPRPLGLAPGQAAALKALARHVVALMELRVAVVERDAALVQRNLADRQAEADAETLRETAMRLGVALEAAETGIFDYDIRTGALQWDRRTRELFGLSKDAALSYEGAFLAGLHPDDRARTDAAVRAALDPAGSRAFASEYRTVSPADGRVRRVAALGRLIVEDGVARRLIGAVRDVTGQRAAEQEVAATIERYHLAARATNDAIWDWDLVADHVLWNEALTSAYGYAPKDVTPNGAWWLERIHPDDRDRVESDIRRVIAEGGAEWSHHYRFRRADGGYADVYDRGYVIRSKDGAAIRMIGAMLDLTERKQAEEEFRALFEGANVGVVQFDPHTDRARRVNPKLCEIWGASAAEIIEHPLSRWTLPDDLTKRTELLGRILRGEVTGQLIEKRYRRADGGIIWARVNFVSRPIGDGVQSTAMIEDITAEKQAETLREAVGLLGDRLRDLDDAGEIAAVAAELLGRTLGVVRSGYGAIDPTRTFVDIERDWTAAGFDSAQGRCALAAFGDGVDALTRGESLAVADVDTDPRCVAHAAGCRASGIRALLNVPILEHGRLVALFFLHDSTPRLWSPEVLDFVQSVADRTRAAVARVRAEEQQKLLNHEIGHRMKNILAMVHGIASQTLRSAPDLATAREALANRLIALAAAQGVLFSGPLARADMAGVARGAVRMLDDPPGRISISGPQIEIGPHTAVSLALMLHELGTNAVKYGAFSAPGGWVSIGWRIEDTDGVSILRLWWDERGGPPVAAPGRKGFGSRLIERGLPARVGGSATIEYAPSGLICTVTAPLAGFLQSD